MAKDPVRRAFDIDDVRDLARRRLPRGIFDFVDRGCGQDVAVYENRAAFDRIKLVPRALIDVSERTTTAQILGKTHSMPLAIAPTGATGLVWYKGEIELARAAAAAGVPFSLATRSMSSIEAVAKEAGGTLWFQLYPSKERELSKALIKRAAMAGYEALIVTVDSPTVPRRPYNERNGLTQSYKPGTRFMVNALLHPRWLVGVIGQYTLNRNFPRFENLPDRPPVLRGSPPGNTFDGTVSWDMIRDLRHCWPGKFMVKGILRPSDASRAVDHGADAIVVSNHGGRNLDAAPASIDVVSSIVEAVGSRASVLLDSGIRSGGDIVKAMALGASSVLIGRPVIYGTAVGGEVGARKVLELLRQELSHTLSVLGCRCIDDIDRDLIFAGPRA